MANHVETEVTQNTATQQAPSDPEIADTPAATESLETNSAPSIDRDNELALLAETSAQGGMPTKQEQAAPNLGSGKLPYSDPRPNRLLIKLMSPIARHLVLKGALRHKRIDFPSEEVDRFRRFINKDTVAFIGPNHPEIFVDWVVDKEVSSRVSPYMANWADASFVNSSPLGKWFWLRHNLIANSGKELAKEYSLRWAEEGHGVLLHPEGGVNWSGDKIHDLFAGIAEMPIEAAKRLAAGAETDKKVYIVPFIMRYNFTRDVSPELHKEMQRLENKLGLAQGSSSQTASERFAALQVNLLVRREKDFDYQNSEPITPANFFKRQSEFFDLLMAQLKNKYGPQDGSLSRQIHVYERLARQAKSTDEEGYKQDIKIVAELRRLLGFGDEVYNTPVLTQEQIAESLKRIQASIVRCHLAKTGFLDTLRTTVPVPVASREVHIRLAEPIEVGQYMTPGVDEKALKDLLLLKTHTAMQVKLDALRTELEPVVLPYARTNPFFLQQVVQ